MSGGVHATAIVVGTSGLLLVGPSGAGKSRLALTLIADARNQGQFGALVADDRVFLEKHGERIVARRPQSIRDLIEIRGSGIGRIDSVEQAVMHWAVLPIAPGGGERLPQENETHEIEEGFYLPALRLQTDLQAPYSAFLALLAAVRAAPT